MDFLTAVVLFVMFSTPQGDRISVIPVPNMDTCEVMASVIVGVVKYECVYVTDGDDA